MYSGVVVATVVDIYSGVVVGGKSKKKFRWIKRQNTYVFNLKLHNKHNKMIVLTVITT